MKRRRPFYIQLWKSLLHGIRWFRENNQLKVLTIRENLAGYSRSAFFQDLTSGLNVALLAFPQGMAYALIAGLPVKYGIYCGAIAPIIAGLMGSSRFCMIGPTNATAVLLGSILIDASANGIDPIRSISLLTCMVGALLLAGAFLKLATLTQYVSRTVIIGYITAAAALIIAKQMQHVFGLQVEPTALFYLVCWRTVGELLQLSWDQAPTIALSFLTLTLLLFLQKRWPKLPNVAIALVVCGIVAQLMIHFGPGTTMSMVNAVEPGSWQFSPPAANAEWFSKLLVGALAIAFLASLENTFMAKDLANRTGQRVDVNQEMLSLGSANIASGLFTGMPASGSLTRSALNWSSGAVSPISGITSAVICAIMVLLFGHFIQYIPKASLAVVVIFTAIALFQPQTLRIALNSTRNDATVLVLTIIVALIAPLTYAIFLGVAVSILLFMRQASSPSLVEYSFNAEGNLTEIEQQEGRNDPQISIIHVEGELFFGAADLFRDQIRRVCADPNLAIVILRMKNARHLDATSVLALSELIHYLRETDRHLIISGASREVYKVLRDSGIMQLLGRDNFFLASFGNPNASTRKALLRARELMGRTKADIRIFYDPQHVAEKQAEAQKNEPSSDKS